MNILLIHNYYQQRGGEDTVFDNELALLQNSEHSVETLTFHNDELKQLSKQQAGIKLFNNKQAAEQLEEKIKAFSPDIIHIHNFFPLASPAIYKTAGQFNIPVVQTLHNFRLICSNALLFKNGQVCESCINKTLPLNGIINKCYRDSSLQTLALTTMVKANQFNNTWHNDISKYIALTEFAKQKFNKANLKLPLEKMVTKPNFTFDSGIGDYNQRENYILFIGRLSVEKDIPTLLEAFKNTETPLKIIGDGPFRTMVEAATSKHKNIEYLGYQNKEQVMTYLKKSRAFILPSTCYEGCPMTILESLSTGTPVLVSKTGGLAEFVQHKINGLHFTPGNAQELQAQVNTISYDNDLHLKLSFQARESYLKHYTPEQHLKSIIEIYHSVLRQN